MTNKSLAEIKYFERKIRSLESINKRRVASGNKSPNRNSAEITRLNTKLKYLKAINEK